LGYEVEPTIGYADRFQECGMAVIQAFRRLERGFAWSFFGFVLAACFGGLALYTEFFKNRSPQLEFEIVSNTPVLTTREDVARLKILYEDVDIRQTRQALSVVSIRVRNTGDADILNASYDERAPVGVDVVRGTILEPRIIDASNEYLRANARCQPSGTNSLDFVPVILERREFYLVKFLVLHQDSTLFQVRPRGKVAGVRQITVTDFSGAEQSPGFVALVIGGTVGVQVMRLCAYSVAFLVLLVGIVGAASAIGTWWSRGRRRRTVRRFRASYKGLDSTSERLFETYTNDGPDALATMARALRRDPSLRRAARELARMTATPELRAQHKERDILIDAMDARHLYVTHWSNPQRLLDVGLIRREGDALVVNATLKKVLDDFAEFHRRPKGEIQTTA
jgi:hypothetical protein